MSEFDDTMQQKFETARDVSEYLLKCTAAAMQAGDFETFSTYFALPQDIQTFEGRRLIRTSEQFNRVFGAVRAHYERNGVTDIVRRCIEAEFYDAYTITSTHETRLISRNIMVQEPFPVMSVLKCEGGTWRITSMSYAIEDRKDHNAALMCAGEVHSG